MDSLEELGQRVTNVEGEVARARQDAADARSLAAGADRDVSEVRAQLQANGRVLSALRTTQLEHYREHKADAAEIKEQLKASNAKIEAGLTQIVRMLQDMEGGVEGRSN